MNMDKIKSIDQYAFTHGEDKAKALVKFYAVPFWDYDYSDGKTSSCHDCGVKIKKGVRCASCYRQAYEKAFGKQNDT